MAAKDRSISDLEKRVGVLTREKESVEQQLRLVQSGEGTRLGDLQRMVEAQAFELSSQEAALAEVFGTLLVLAADTFTLSIST